MTDIIIPIPDNMNGHEKIFFSATSFLFGSRKEIYQNRRELSGVK